MKKIVFLTGTRADYGKIKSLMKKVDLNPGFDLHVFVTGMHMLTKYGSTYHEIEKDKFTNVYKFINQTSDFPMDLALSNSIIGLTNYFAELKPDMIVVHGDRLEALAGAIVGAFNNIKVAHIEGGEISGTIDESIRHAITKFSHFHFVANQEAKKRVIQLGEKEETVFIIGSPDIDIMCSGKLPSIDETKSRYEIEFTEYALALYHPVTTEIDEIENNIKTFIAALEDSEKNIILIYPNNDLGSDIIISEFKKINNKRIKIFPSIRFEYFLTLLKNCAFIVGNSSTGIREAGIFGVPSIDVGNRQQGRYRNDQLPSIMHVRDDYIEILECIKIINSKLKFAPYNYYGNGNSDDLFINIIEEKKFWEISIQKIFIDSF